MTEHADLRVYAVSRASERLLQHVGAWDRMDASRRCSYERMVVWETGKKETQALTFDCADLGEPNLGHIVEDTLLRRAVYDVAQGQPNLRLMFNSSLTSLEVDDEDVAVELAGGESVSASLVVAADGTASPVRERLGIRTLKFSYGQRALVAHIGMERGHQDTAWQRFLSTGPVALLPMAQGFAGLVWSLPTETAEALQGRERRRLPGRTPDGDWR